MTHNKVAGVVIGLMQALRVPISLLPFWHGHIGAERNLYRPFLQPWRADALFRSVWNDVGGDTTSLEEWAYLLFSLAKMAAKRPGEFWECGVYKGATARLLAEARNFRADGGALPALRLFDTFAGVPERRPSVDGYKLGSLGDTSLDRVKARLASYDKIDIRSGLIPATFAGLEASSIAFAHVDVVQYETTKACCEFIVPRLVTGGILVIDDYGRPKTSGCRLAADEYFAAHRITPLVLNTGQAVILN